MALSRMYDERQIGPGAATPREPIAAGRIKGAQPLDLARFLRALRRGWKLLLSVALIGVVLGFVIPKFLMPRQWLSQAQLVYEGMVVEKDGEKIIDADPRDLRTMVDSVKLPTNLRQVQEEVGESGPLSQFASRIDVSYDEQSNLITISALSDSSRAAAELANTMVDIFVDHRESVDRERLRKIVETTENDLKLAEAAVNEARKRYKSFRDEKGIVDLTVEREQAIEEAAAYRARAVEAAEEVAKLEAQIKAREDQAAEGNAPKGSAADRTALREAEGELRDARTRYTDEHPQVQALLSRVKLLKARISSGSGGGSANTSKLKLDLSTAQEREKRLREQADRAEGSINKFSSDEGAASSLLATIQVAEANVKKLRDDLVKAEADARSPRSGFRVESPAVAPELPEPSQARYAVAAGLPAGGILIVLLVLFWKEFGDLTVHTAAETAFWGRGPVVGTTTWPREQHLLDALVAEMDDYLVDAAGKTLVVPATDRELQFAQAISERLTGLDGEPASVGQVSVQTVHELEDKDRSIELPASPAEPGSAIVAHHSHGTLVREQDAPWMLSAEAWTGPSAGPSIRRAARMSDRVLVIVQAGHTRFAEMREVPGRLGRDTGIGYLLVGIEEDFEHLPDRAGSLDKFWYAYRA